MFGFELVHAEDLTGQSLQEQCLQSIVEENK